MEAIILAGGLGTRLKDTVPDLPKPMAPINGRPFLAFLLDALIASGFKSAILALGYRHEVILQHFGGRYRSLNLRHSIEKEPLGTGGAIWLALEQASHPEVFVLNGDTYVDLDFRGMMKNHIEEGATLTVAVRQVNDTRRYGALDIESGRIRGFSEKGRSGPGVINAGAYLLPRALPERYRFSHVFSFETDFLMSHVDELKPLAFPARGRFIDIGIPEDYARAQHLLGPASAQPAQA